MSGQSITIKAMGGVHVRMSKPCATERWVVALFRKGRGPYAPDTEVAVSVGDSKDNPRLLRNYRGVCVLAVSGLYVDLPEASAVDVAGFLGLEVPSNSGVTP